MHKFAPIRIGPEGLRLRDAKVCMQAAGKGHSSHYEDIRGGTWTKGVRLGPKCVRWPQYEIDALIAARIAGQSPAELQVLVQHLHSLRPQLLSQFVPGAA